jgi:DUF971 family protein
LKPASITANREKKELAIICDDGHTSLYTFSSLRAECRGGHDKMGDTPDPSVFKADLPNPSATCLDNVIPVGSYGITTFWEDGHVAGIYHWEYLQAMCPFAECRK